MGLVCTATVSDLPVDECGGEAARVQCDNSETMNGITSQSWRKM